MNRRLYVMGVDVDVRQFILEGAGFVLFLGAVLAAILVCGAGLDALP